MARPDLGDRRLCDGRDTTNDISNGQQLWRSSSTWNWTLTGAVGGGVDCFQ